MSYEWITPKTDWTTTSRFEYTDYNRIRNNLLYINEKLNELYPDKAQSLDLGDAKTGYANEYTVSEFNAFEDALESFTRVGQDVNVGDRNYYRGNNSFIWADALNRLEQCCVRWKDKTENQVREIVPETTDWQVPYYKYSYLPITLIPSNATNINDLDVVKISSPPNVLFDIENKQLKIYAGHIGVASVKLVCGQVEKMVDITILATTASIYVSLTKNGDTQLGGMTLNVNSDKNVYVVTYPKNAIDRENYTYVLSDSSIANIIKDDDKLTITAVKSGQTTLVVALNEYTYSLPITVR